MKSKIILISIFLLAICLISPIAASDNITDDNLQTAEDITVSYNHTVYEKDLGYIDVELPNGTGGNLKATINNVEFYNENVSSSVKIPITIPKEAISLIVVNKNTDHATYHMNLFLDNITILNDSLKVMRIPSNFTTPGFQSEILKDDPGGYVSFYMPESADGRFDVYIDGQFALNFTSHQYNFMNASKFNTLALGNHNVTLVYAGDEYYKKFNKTFNFSVVDMLITIPQHIVFDHDDCISGSILHDKDGVVSIFVDNKLVFKSKLDKYGEFLFSLFNDLTCGNHTVEVQYKASKFSYSKKVNVTASYYVDLFCWGPFIYKGDGEVVIIVPTDFNKDLINITLDGVRVTDFTIDLSGWIELDIKDLGAGNHAVTFDFPGDAKYTNYTISANFTIEYLIVMPEYADFKIEKIVQLFLPETADGLLEVYINGEFYKSDKMDEGFAAVYIDDLIPGNYNITAKYTGTDFNVSEASKIMDFKPSIITPGEIYCGEDKSIVVNSVKGANGKVIFTMGNQNITVDMVNGKAILPLKNLKVGSYDDMEVKYVGDDGYTTPLYTILDILPVQIKLTNVKATSESAKMKVYINSKLVKNTYVSFKVDGKAKKVKTDKNGVATIKLAPGKHTITAIYKTAKATKSVNVHVISLKSVTVKKSAKKVVLSLKLKQGQKLLKNKVVKFKFNGKTIKAKTNKKGIAKATFKTSNLKVGKKVTYSATYLKDTVQKTATVKK